MQPDVLLLLVNLSHASFHWKKLGRHTTSRVSLKKPKTMAFEGKYGMRLKIKGINEEIIGKVSNSIHLGCKISVLKA
jgi:hypothetical protein